MARAKSGGGARKGTPGKAYSNRTDLNTNYGQSAPGASVASGGMVAPAPSGPPPGTAPLGAPIPPIAAGLTPDQVPALDDPTSRPHEPISHGMVSGPGGGPEVMGNSPGTPAVTMLRAAYLRNPTPELRRALSLVDASGML